MLVEREGVDEDALMDVALSGGAEDISEDGDQWQITTEPHDFMTVRDGPGGGRHRLRLGRADDGAEDDRRAQREGGRQILRLVDQLEENDDVQDVYANFDISEEVLEAVAG